MSRAVQIFHDELDATVLVPAKAVAHYQERGWVRVETIEPEFPYQGDPRDRTNEPEPDYDVVESTSDDQEE